MTNYRQTEKTRTKTIKSAASVEGLTQLKVVLGTWEFTRVDQPNLTG